MSKAEAALFLLSHFALHQVLPGNGLPAKALAAYDRC